MGGIFAFRVLVRGMEAATTGEMTELTELSQPLVDSLIDGLASSPGPKITFPHHLTIYPTLG